MSRFVIETFSGRIPNLVIKLVFFSYGYNNRWMRTASGTGTTIPYIALEQLIVKKLEGNKRLDVSFFEEYKRVAEQALLNHLINKGKRTNASERARQRIEDICDGLRAIVVIDTMGRKLRVHCINKSDTVATYDPRLSTVNIGDEKWVVAPQELGQTSYEPSALKERKTLISLKKIAKHWWRRHSFAFFSTIFFVIMATAIIAGLFVLKRMIEDPDRSKKLPGYQTDSTTLVITNPPIDSITAAQADSFVIITDTAAKHVQQNSASQTRQ